MLTNNNIQKCLTTYIQNHESEIIGNPKDEQVAFIKELTRLGFDYIITTNYTYEIEQSMLALQFVRCK